MNNFFLIPAKRIGTVTRALRCSCAGAFFIDSRICASRASDVYLYVQRIARNLVQKSTIKCENKACRSTFTENSVNMYICILGRDFKEKEGRSLK